MYLYSLCGYDYNEVLTHDRQFTEEEFTSMCDEVPKDSIEYSDGTQYYYDGTLVKNHLINVYGFKEANYEAGIFTD